MFQIRIHGRGGQGVVTSAELIAIAAFAAGKEAQAFPFFGVERTGAPIEAYARIDTKPIRVREQVYHPDLVIIQDQTLIGTVDVAKGCGARSKILVNSGKQVRELSGQLNVNEMNVHVIDASRIAMEIFGKNIINTVILGAFAKLTDLITLEQLKSAIREKFADKGKEIIEKNIRAAEKSYDIIRINE